jgi:hypothetical protein
MLAEVFPLSTMLHEFTSLFMKGGGVFAHESNFCTCYLTKAHTKFLEKDVQSIKFACLDIPCKFLRLDALILAMT